MTQRDTFISELFEIAKKDKDVILISVDMGASSLDRWREELPEQFIWTGISEQHSINLAAGLSAAGKKVYVYFMAAWSARWLRWRINGGFKKTGGGMQINTLTHNIKDLSCSEFAVQHV